MVGCGIKGPPISLINTRNIRGSLYALKSRATLYILQLYPLLGSYPQDPLIYPRKHLIDCLFNRDKLPVSWEVVLLI